MSSQTGKLLIAICLLVPFVVILNLGLWTALRRRSNPNRTKMNQQTRGPIAYPWLAEDQRLKELSDRVAGIKNRSQPSVDSDPDNSHHSGDPGPEGRP